MQRFAVTLVLTSFLAGCGGDDGGQGSADARPIGDSADPRPCTAPETFGSPTPTNQSSIHYPTDADGYEEIDFNALLDADMPGDGIYISLFNNLPPFGATVSSTTVQLTGDQADYATCGACVEIDTDLDESDAPTDVYFANGGNLILSSVSGMFTGTISNATFVHSDFDNDTLETTPNADGCMTTVGSLSFTATVVESSGNLRSAKANRKRLHLRLH